jgi:L-threonylcarbamoyladenylate synthase
MSIIRPTQEALEEAAKTIRSGGVVVMPTETVYGLACSALKKKAVTRVFEIKGRPMDNPLIVHLADVSQLGLVASSWPKEAELLADRFWPGPLTMVLPRKDSVPLETTGGLDTVAVRVPSHPIALDLIRMADCPVAAPSANLFMGLSPTRPDMIDPAIQVDVDITLDGGPCEVGLESTVVDLTGDHPRILRPGGVTRAQIQAVIGQPLGQFPPNSVRKSPGMHRRHYAPDVPVELVKSVTKKAAGLVFGEPANSLQVRMPQDARGYGALLYSAMQKIEQGGAKKIFVESPPETPEWEAVNDRLTKASAEKSGS